MNESIQTSEEKLVICELCKYTGFPNEKVLFNYCPKCGAPTELWQEIISSLFVRLPTSIALEKATTQFRKNEFEAAARTSLIVVEEAFKKLSGIDSHGTDLVSKAFCYKLDGGGYIVEYPRIRINELKTDTDKGEHDGIKLLCIGTMKGIRNIIAHSSAHIGPKTCLSIILLSDLILDIIKDGSIINERHCIWTLVREDK